MKAEFVEFRFPDGDFELDSTEDVPKPGAIVTKKGGVWKVDAVESGTTILVTLVPAGRSEGDEV